VGPVRPVGEEMSEKIPVTANTVVLEVEKIVDLTEEQTDKILTQTLLESRGSVGEEPVSYLVVLLDVNGEMHPPLRLVQMKAAGYRVIHYHPNDDEYVQVEAKVKSGKIVKGLPVADTKANDPTVH